MEYEPARDRPRNPETIQVFFRAAGDAKHRDMRVPLHAKVDNITSKLYDQGIAGPPRYTRLLFNGKQLHPDETLAERGVRHGDTLEVRYLQPGGAPKMESMDDRDVPTPGSGSSKDVPTPVAEDFPPLPPPGTATSKASVSNILPQPGPSEAAVRQNWTPVACKAANAEAQVQPNKNPSPEARREVHQAPTQERTMPTPPDERQLPPEPCPRTHWK